MHDIGKVTMLMCLEDSLSLVTALIEAEVQEQQEQGKLWAHAVVEIERFLMKDIDHQIIGGRLADRWEMAPEIQQVISHHHEPHEQSPPLLKLVALANLAGSTLFPYPATDAQHPFPQLFQRIEQAMKKSGKTGPEGIDEAISQDIFEDLVDVLNRLEIPSYLWEIVDFKTFFKICYMLAPKIRSAAIAFLQQTG
jgi:HD-like signal output (HDOD) protein